MTKLKTTPTQQSVEQFIDALDNPKRRADCLALLALFTAATKLSAVMWGDNMIGFGQYEYQNSAGKNQWFLTGFSPRKHDLTIYIMCGFEQLTPQLELLGKHRHTKSCLYIKQLSDIDLDILRTIIQDSVAQMKHRYG